MTGTSDSRATASKPEKAEDEAVKRYFTAVEKLHLAHAEVARVRGDLASKGISLDSVESERW